MEKMSQGTEISTLTSIIYIKLKNEFNSTDKLMFWTYKFFIDTYYVKYFMIEFPNSQLFINCSIIIISF